MVAAAPLRVAVCGLDPAGLTASLLLARQGAQVTAIEREGSARAPVGAGILLQPIGQVGWQHTLECCHTLAPRNVCSGSLQITGAPGQDRNVRRKDIEVVDAYRYEGYLHTHTRYVGSTEPTILAGQ